MTITGYREEAKTLVNNLIQAAYDSGYLSGRGEDGSTEHLSAIRRRKELREQVVKLLLKAQGHK